MPDHETVNARAAWPAPKRATLAERVPAEGTIEPGEILNRFLDWVEALGLEPYPAQADALLELMAGCHVILNTPTGSGKSLVAQALHFKAICEGRWSCYTSPTKALASEKFFDLCGVFGPENVGMLTGDASINRDAPVLCCTAEILSDMLLRGGPGVAPPYVVMDEFHYYADPQRGVAWQVPLISAPDTTFLIMSATLGDVSLIARRLLAFSGRPVATVSSDERPVPLDYEYRETPIQETVENLLARRMVPLYIVNFTHDECAELAQALTSIDVCSRDETTRIAEALKDTRFHTPYGKELRRFLRFGIAVHHAGLLPRYRLLVEQLAQQGLLKIICGTDTLGVGVNIPIRTVLFAKLAKYDGERTGILTARDFKQIAGRAGRKGFDEQGSVICQAPEHIIARRRLAERPTSAGKRPRAKAPPTGTVVWERNTFDKLVGRPPEPLVSRFRVSHGMILNVLQREPGGDPAASGYAALVGLVCRSHEDDSAKRRLLREAAALFRALRRAGIVGLARDEVSGRNELRVSTELQADFSLHQTLSLYLVDAVSVLEPRDPDYALDVLSLAEAILEDPRRILVQQERKAKAALLARLKAEHVPYEERLAQLEAVTYPQPRADFIYATFDLFAAKHPWVRPEDIRPKSIAREMLEGYADFEGYLRAYALQRSEGVLLRYLSQVYKTLVKTVPEANRNEDLLEIIAFLRAMLGQVDESLVEEWERLMGIARRPARERPAADAVPTYDLATDRPALEARIRVEMRHLVRALAAGDYEAAAGWVRLDAIDPWNAARFEAALAPFFREYDGIEFEPGEVKRHHTVIRQTAPRTWEVMQVIFDSAGDNLWHVAGVVDLIAETNPAEPLVRPFDIRP